MRRLRSTLAILFTLPVAGCVGTTECSCVAPVVVVVGTITGTNALPQAGPVCIVVTAATLDLPLVTATRRVDAVITTPPMAGPQQVRADVAFSTP